LSSQKELWLSTRRWVKSVLSAKRIIVPEFYTFQKDEDGRIYTDEWIDCNAVKHIYTKDDYIALTISVNESRIKGQDTECAVPNADDTNFVTANGLLVVSGERVHFTGDGSDVTGLGAIVSPDYNHNERVVKSEHDCNTVDNDPGNKKPDGCGKVGNDHKQLCFDEQKHGFCGDKNIINVDELPESNFGKDEIVFIYPFVGGQMLDSAGNNLDLGENAKENISEDMLLELQRSNCRSNKHSRRSSIQFRENYCNCLCREAYLNDDITSFWLLWILRREHPNFSCIYPLESHFFSSMSDEVSCIGNCVEKYLHLDFKRLNYILLPINENKHWSLCIIINPGLVTKYSPQERSNPDFETESFLVILDSLTYHDPDKIARLVRRWLNDLWKQRYGAGDIDFFDEITIPMLKPSVSQQDNSYDCGLFVCKYALAFYQMDKPLSRQVTENLESQMSFQFPYDSNAMAIFRDNVSLLLQKIRWIYSHHRGESSDADSIIVNSNLPNDMENGSSPNRSTSLDNNTNLAIEGNVPSEQNMIDDMDIITFEQSATEVALACTGSIQPELNRNSSDLLKNCTEGNMTREDNGVLEQMVTKVSSVNSNISGNGGKSFMPFRGKQLRPRDDKGKNVLKSDTENEWTSKNDETTESDAELTDSEDSRSGVEPGGGKLRGKRLGKLLRLSYESELVLSDDEKDRFVKQRIRRRKSKRKKASSNVVILPEGDDPICADCESEVRNGQKCYKCEKPLHAACGFTVKDKINLPVRVCPGCHGDEKRYRNTKMNDYFILNHGRVEPEEDKEKDVPLIERKSFNNVLKQIVEMRLDLGQKSSMYCGKTAKGKVLRVPSNLVEENLLFYFEKELQGVKSTSSKKDSWYTLSSEVRKFIGLHARCLSVEFLRDTLELCESTEWKFMKLRCYSSKLPKNYRLVDLRPNIPHLDIVYVCLSNDIDNWSETVEFVPLYFLEKWRLGSPKEFEQTMKKAQRKVNEWFQLESGVCRGSPFVVDMPDMPRSHRVQPYGEFSCVFNSLVNALNYINDFDGRDVVLSKLRASMDFDEYGDLAKNRMKFAMRVMNVDVKGYDSRIMKHFDILGDQSYWPTLCILEGSDGGVNHAVTVVENFIFDSNNHTAIPLTRENLDFCCLSDFSLDVKFHRVHFACRFTRHQAHSQYVLRSSMKYQLAISSMMQCFTHVEDVLASESIQRVSQMLNPGVDVMGMVRDVLNRKPHGYQLRLLRDWMSCY